MRLLIVSYGSTGDIYPYVALGAGLRNAGFDVSICTNSRYKTLLSEHKLQLIPLNDEITELLESLTGRKALENLNSFLGFIKTALHLAKDINRIQSNIIEDAWRAVNLNKPDVVVFNAKTHFVRHFAELEKCQLVAAPLFPQAIATSSFPTLGFPSILGRKYNRLSYRVIKTVSNWVISKPLRNWRKHHKLANKFVGLEIEKDTLGNAIPVINAYSPTLVPQPDDYPQNCTTTGFFQLPKQNNWQPPTSLLQFIKQGPMPIYIGFGSMSAADNKKTTEIIFEAIKLANVRAIIATGWGGLKANDFPEEVYQIAYAPHDWLFQHVCAAIHHGGAGTTAASLLHGLPTLICPVFGDQPLWGNICYQLGVGPRPMPLSKLKSKSLAKAIVQLLSDSNIKASAQQVSKKLSTENGVSHAVEIISKL